MKIYYLTRSYLPSKTGGTLIRKAQVDFFQKNGIDVEVITPNYNSSEVECDDNITRIPYGGSTQLPERLERYGVYDDYLDGYGWIKKTFKYLKGRLKKNDVVFATSGGELGNIKLASLLKKKIGCKFVVNLHDPIDYSLVNGLLINNWFHVSREKKEHKYLRNADLIITTSKSNEASLKNKFPDLKSRIKNNYFGYISQSVLKRKSQSKFLRIAYAGNFGPLQSPEKLLEIIDGIDGVKIYFIGNYSFRNKFNETQKSIHEFIPFLQHDKFTEFMIKNVDVGFVSLVNDYVGACVPSKIYEYINLGLPTIGALPEGDALDLINKNGYGIACKYDNIDCLKAAVNKLKVSENLNSIKDKIMQNREKWYMGIQINEIIEWIKEL